MTVWVHSPFDNLPQEGFRRQRYWLMAEAFAAAGHEVVYWTSDFNHGTKARRVMSQTVDSKVQLRLVETVPYVKNVSLKRVFSHLLYARRLDRAIRGVARPALIVSAVPTLGAAATLLRYARKVGARFVLDIQDAWPETFCRLGIPRTCLLPMTAYARRLYREADRVTGVSERYRTICGRADYRVFYHGITAVDGPCRPSQPKDRTSLVYIGNLGSGYDLQTVISAVAADSSLTLDIAGRGPQEASLRAFVREMKVEARVRFHGYLAQDALRDLLARSDVGVIPMRDDSWVGLPYKLGDYLAAGLPVVSSLHGECGDLLVREGLGATYEFASVQSLLQAVSVASKIRAVLLPSILRAEQIYPQYVDDVGTRQL